MARKPPVWTKKSGTRQRRKHRQSMNSSAGAINLSLSDLKALAVRRVTENDGKKTPGVDQEIWDTPEKKTQAVHELKRRGYQPQPLRSQGSCRSTSDRKRWQENPRCGPRNLGHAREENTGSP